MKHEAKFLFWGEGRKFVKQRLFNAMILSFPFIAFFQVNAYANSSWHWVTVSPLKVMPFAVAVTLIVETIAVIRIGKAKDAKKAFRVVGCANLFSFLAPYIVRAYRFIPTSGGFSLKAAFNKGPYYMVLSGYLVLTLIVELPVVYLLLRKDSGCKKGLALSILASNIITTLFVAVCERLICIGQW